MVDITTPERVNPDYEDYRQPLTFCTLIFEGSRWLTMTTVSIPCAFKICSRLLPVVADHLVFRSTTSLSSTWKWGYISTLGDSASKVPNGAMSLANGVFVFNSGWPGLKARIVKTVRGGRSDFEWTASFHLDRFSINAFLLGASSIHWSEESSNLGWEWHSFDQSLRIPGRPFCEIFFGKEVDSREERIL